MATFGENEWNDHAALIGAVTLAWNRNVYQLLRVFTHLTGVESPVADAIFFSPQSDSSQRKLIKRVAEAVKLAELDLHKLNKLLNRLEKVSTGRNLAAHIIFGLTAFDQASGIWGPKVVPALTPPQDHRLQDDFTAQFKKVERELAAIFQGFEHWLDDTPFPERPWGGPPLPIAAAAQLQRTLAETEFLQRDAVDHDGAGNVFHPSISLLAHDK